MVLFTIEWSRTIKIILVTVLVIALLAAFIILYFLLKSKKYGVGINNGKTFNLSNLKTFGVVRNGYEITKEQLYEACENELLSTFYDEEYAIGEYVNDSLIHFNEIHPIMKSFGKFYKDEDDSLMFKLFEEPIDVVSKLKYPLNKRIIVNRKNNPKIIVQENEYQYVISLKKNHISPLQLGVVEKYQDEIIVKINKNKKAFKNYSLYKDEIVKIIDEIKKLYVTKK